MPYKAGRAGQRFERISTGNYRDGTAVMSVSVSPTVRVSFGLIMLTLSILFLSDFLGLVPEQQALDNEHRKKFSESLAIQFSSLAHDGDTKHIRTTLEALVSRNEDIESAAFRSLVGEGTVEVGDHAGMWLLEEDAEVSIEEQVVVPIFKGDKRWGSLEVRFASKNSSWYSALTGSSFFMLCLFFAVSGFFLYMLFLRRVLRELDPSQVVPERVTHAFDSLAEGLLILDENGLIVLANKAFHRSASVKGSMIGTSAKDLNWSVYQADSGVREDRLPWVRVMKSGKSLTGERLTIHNGSNLERSYAINCTPIHDETNKIRGVITTFDDLTDTEKRNETLKQTLVDLKQTKTDVDLKNKELQYLATRDSLTGCLNRRAFTDQYTKLFDNAEKYQTDLICLMVDIDHFKRINDNYGHAVGDKVIQFVAETLGKQIRSDDLLGRYGGEEFSIILDATSLDQAVAVAERMRTEISSGDPSLFTSALRVTASFGVASIHDELDDMEELVNKADKALYLAKESGRNKVVVWDPQLEERESEARDASGVASDEPLTGEVVAGRFGLSNEDMDSSERIRQLELIAAEKAEMLDRYVSYDQLTQLPERNLFKDRVEQALQLAKRDGRVMAVLSLGLEDLHRVSDTLGYESAADLLRETARRLQEALRSSDAISLLEPVDSEATISKLSEGEFGLLLPTVKDAESIAWVIKRIFNALEEPLFINDHNMNITCNVGVGVYPGDGEDGATLIRNASVSRYYAEQQSGVNNVEYFSEQINRVSREQLHLESQMTSAVDNDEFEILLQPKIDLQSGEISGFESLLRWNHPTRGVLTPNEFIEIAERTRLINLIGDWVLDQSCRSILELSRLCGRELICAVNLSPVQISQPDLVERILGILKANDFDPTNLELELTENCLMENMAQAFSALAELQSHGIRISIDDFGTGYSGLGYLRTLPINILKVDRCFVADIGENDDSTAIVSAIVSMAKALELTVVAEGVETPAQLEALTELACDEAQGYLFSRPLSMQKARNLVSGSIRLSNTG